MMELLERMVTIMTISVSYKRLWHMLLDLNLKKLEFAKRAGISGATLAKLGGDKMVALDVIGKICITLGCTPNDILEFTAGSDDATSTDGQ